MKTTFILILTLLPLQRLFALHIAEVSLAALSETELSISMNTEAVELFYFQSWQYVISGNTIVLEALFVPGFGSTIAYLNTNFQIPMNTTNEAAYHLFVKVYYTNYEPENLQETAEGFFSTPLFKTILLGKNDFQTNDKSDFSFVNPTNDGEIKVNPEIKAVWVFDFLGKCIQKFSRIQSHIQLGKYPDGMYILGYFRQNQFKTKRIILKKK